MLYFAYGSNLAKGAMSLQCPGSKYVGRAQLRGYRLAFTRRSIRTGTGVADVVPCSGGYVWGALYEVNEEALAALDRKEGHGWAYMRVPVVVYVNGGAEPAGAITYRVLEPEPNEVPPSRDYVGRLVEAARYQRFPSSYIDRLAGLERKLLSG
jgi:gamma-glutamylcyclotransferase